METFLIIIQVIVAFGIYNVWLVRPRQATAYRGKNARTIRQEFKAYGLPGFAVYVIGFLKIGLASIILAGLWYPGIAGYAAIGLAVLMAGAVAMHIKVRDPLKKALPATVMLVLSVLIALFA